MNPWLQALFRRLSSGSGVIIQCRKSRRTFEDSQLCRTILRSRPSAEVFTRPRSHDDDRAAQRSQPRLEKIKAGEGDMADTLAYLGTLPKFNGRAAAMGFCYGGPYAILGPKRLGYAAGISCHGTQMLDYIQELDGVAESVCIIWGDQDHRAPVGCWTPIAVYRRA